eukprot:jgi/Botrbrau1/10938/Bobra.0025s0111.1
MRIMNAAHVSMTPVFIFNACPDTYKIRNSGILNSAYIRLDNVSWAALPPEGEAQIYKVVNAYLSIPTTTINVFDATGYGDAPELVFTATIRLSNLPADFIDGDRWLDATTTDTPILEALTKVALDPYEDFTLAAVDISKIKWATCKVQRHKTVWLTESVNGVFKVWASLPNIFLGSNFEEINCPGPTIPAEPDAPMDAEDPDAPAPDDPIVWTPPTSDSNPLPGHVVGDTAPAATRDASPETKPGDTNGVFAMDLTQHGTPSTTP